MTVVPSSTSLRFMRNVFTPKALNISAQGREQSERTLGSVHLVFVTLTGLNNRALPRV